MSPESRWEEEDQIDFAEEGIAKEFTWLAEPIKSEGRLNRGRMTMTTEQ